MSIRKLILTCPPVRLCRSFTNNNNVLRGGEEVMVDCGGTDATGPFDVSIVLLH